MMQERVPLASADSFINAVVGFFELITQPIFLFPFSLIAGGILILFFRKQLHMPAVLRAMGFGLAIFMTLGGAWGTVFFLSEHIEYVLHIQ